MIPMIYSFLIVSLFGLSACSASSEDRTTQSISSQKASTQTIAGLSWFTDINDALKNAKRSQKNLIVMVGEVSCRWCKKMKERTLTDTRIQKKMAEYILVSLKRSDTEAVSHIKEFDGKIPSFFFMKQNEEVYDSVVGYYKADDFLRYMNEAEE